MEVVILLVFVSLVFVAGALLFFAWNLKEGSHQHADRLALLPLEDEPVAPGSATGSDHGLPPGPDGTDPAKRPATPGDDAHSSH